MVAGQWCQASSCLSCIVSNLMAINLVQSKDCEQNNSAVTLAPAQQCSSAAWLSPGSQATTSRGCCTSSSGYCASSVLSLHPPAKCGCFEGRKMSWNLYSYQRRQDQSQATGTWGGSGGEQQVPRPGGLRGCVTRKMSCFLIAELQHHKHSHNIC